MNKLSAVNSIVFGKLDNFFTGKYKLKCFFNNLNKNYIHIKHK